MLQSESALLFVTPTGLQLNLAPTTCMSRVKKRSGLLGQPTTSDLTRDLHIVGVSLGCSPVGVTALVLVSQRAEQIQTAACYMSHSFLTSSTV